MPTPSSMRIFCEGESKVGSTTQRTPLVLPLRMRSRTEAVCAPEECGGGDGVTMGGDEEEIDEDSEEEEDDDDDECGISAEEVLLLNWNGCETDESPSGSTVPLLYSVLSRSCVCSSRSCRFILCTVSCSFAIFSCSSSFRLSAERFSWITLRSYEDSVRLEQCVP